MTVRELIERLRANGWRDKRRKTPGNQQVFVHPDKPGRRITIWGNLDDDIGDGAARSVMRAADTYIS